MNAAAVVAAEQADRRIYTIDEAAGAAGVTRRTIFNWMRYGVLPSVMVKHSRRIRAGDLAIAAEMLYRPWYKRQRVPR